MNKLQMAHEFMMKKMETETIDNHWELFYSSWRYADAMQAEADKREKEESEKKRADIREMLKANNTFVEREGQHFDDVEWQPDWSQAPEWADWWAIDKDLVSFWHEDKPKFDEVEFYQCGVFCDAPSFGYQGNWQDSLRKRPQ